MGLYHTRLDCWKRGCRGLLITMGDETLNPYLPREPLARATGDTLQADVDTAALYRDASRKFDIYHMHVRHGQTDRYLDDVKSSFGRRLGKGHLEIVDVDGIAEAIVRVVRHHAQNSAAPVLPLAGPEAPAPAPARERSGLLRLIRW